MAALTCDACNGSLTMTDDGQFAVCDFCGTKHTMERVRVKVQEIKGVVEVTKGEAEKERLLKNAETFIKLNDISKALEIYKSLTNDYPDDFNTWMGLAKCYFKELPSKYDKEELLALDISFISELIDVERKVTLLHPESKSTFSALWEEHQKKVDEYSESLIKRYQENGSFEDILTEHLIRSSDLVPKSHTKILNLLKSGAEDFTNALSSPILLERIKYVPKEYGIYGKVKFDVILHGVRRIEYFSSRDAVISCGYGEDEKTYYILFKKIYTIPELINEMCSPTLQEQESINGILLLNTYLNNIPSVHEWIVEYRKSIGIYRDTYGVRNTYNIRNIRIESNIDVSIETPFLYVIFDFTFSSYDTIAKYTIRKEEEQNSKICLYGSKKNIEDMKSFCKKNNLCTECGVKFKLFKKVCSNCGSYKDY